VADYGASRTCRKKLSISAVGVKEKVAKIVHCGALFALYRPLREATRTQRGIAPLLSGGSNY